MNKLIKSILYRIKFELITNRYLWKFIQYYVSELKPKINYYIKIKRKFLKQIKEEKISSLKNINITINVITTCNSNCVFCSYKYFKEKGKTMEFNFFKKIIDEIVKYGAKSINITPLLGESLLDNNLFEKIKYAKKNDLYVSMYSNGILLNKDNNYKKLVDSGIDNISISVGDVNPKVDSEIYNISIESSKERWKGINKLIDYFWEKNEKNISLCFRPKNPPYIIKSDPIFKKILKKLKNDFSKISFSLKYDNWGGLVTQKDLIGIMRIKKPFKNVFLECENLNAVSIFPDGSVRLCGCRIKNSIKDDLYIGNLNKNDIINLLNSKKVKKIKASFLNNNPPEICKNCSFYEPIIKNI